jgi:hypothetical protein
MSNAGCLHASKPTHARYHVIRRTYLGTCHVVSRPVRLSDANNPWCSRICTFSFLCIYNSTMAISARCSSALRIAGRRYPALRTTAPCRSAIGYIRARGFSGSPTWQIRTKEMSDDMLKDLKVNQARLMEDIHSTCEWGTGERWGEYVAPKLCNYNT